MDPRNSTVFSLPISLLLSNGTATATVLHADGRTALSAPNRLSPFIWASLVVICGIYKLLRSFIFPRILSANTVGAGKNNWPSHYSEDDRGAMTVDAAHILVSTVALGLQFSCMHVYTLGDVTEKETNRILLNVNIVASLYLAELLYRDKLHNQTIAHNLLFLFLLGFASTMLFETLQVSFLLTILTLSFHSTTEQLTHLAMLGFRLKWKMRTVWRLLFLSAIQSFATKLASLIGCAIIWAKWQQPNYEAPSSLGMVWSVLFWIVAACMTTVHLYQTYILLRVANTVSRGTGTSADAASTTQAIFQKHDLPADGPEIQSNVSYFTKKERKLREKVLLTMKGEHQPSWAHDSLRQHKQNRHLRNLSLSSSTSSLTSIRSTDALISQLNHTRNESREVIIHVLDRPSKNRDYPPPSSSQHHNHPLWSSNHQISQHTPTPASYLHNPKESPITQPIPLLVGPRSLTAPASRHNITPLGALSSSPGTTCFPSSAPASSGNFSSVENGWTHQRQRQLLPHQNYF